MASQDMASAFGLILSRLTEPKIAELLRRDPQAFIVRLSDAKFMEALIRDQGFDSLHTNSSSHLQTLNSYIEKCISTKQIKALHAQIILHGLTDDSISISKLISFLAFSPNGDLQYAHHLFDKIPQPNRHMYNTLIRAFSTEKTSDKAISLYNRMVTSSISPNEFTFPFVMKACAFRKAYVECISVHLHALKLGFYESLVVVRNGVIRFYVGCGKIGCARKVFDCMLIPTRLNSDARDGNFGTEIGVNTVVSNSGKTMVARTLSKLLTMVGILAEDKVIEVQRTDLVGQFIGHTGLLTRYKIKEAEGGILFVDEAYRLVPASPRDFGLEALEEIMSCMDNGKIVVIFAGYTEPMKRVISSNEGIRRRVSNIFHFDDFSCEQLAKILHLKLPSMDENSPLYGFKLDPWGTSVQDVAALIERGTSAEQRGKMNGGLIDQMLVKARENLDSRIDVECTDEYSMVAITSQDLAAGLQLLRADEKGENYQQSNAEGLLEGLERMARQFGRWEKEKANLEREVDDAGKMGYLLGLTDAARSVKENLPGANLDFLRTQLEQHINKLRGPHLPLLDLASELAEYVPDSSNSETT